jgi:hypothetical protein
MHVANEKAAEDKRIAQQKNPHHCLAPRHLEGLLIVRPILNDTPYA